VGFWRISVGFIIPSENPKHTDAAAAAEHCTSNNTSSTYTHTNVHNTAARSDRKIGIPSRAWPRKWPTAVNYILYTLRRYNIYIPKTLLLLLYACYTRWVYLYSACLPSSSEKTVVGRVMSPLLNAGVLVDDIDTSRRRAPEFAQRQVIMNLDGMTRLWTECYIQHT